MFVVEKQVDSPEIFSLDPAAWVHPGKINAMKSCAYFYWRLATLSGEVSVRFVVLLSLFDRTQGRVRDEKAGRQS